jgi:hypothetical protein
MTNFGGSMHPSFDDSRYIAYAENMQIAKIIVGKKFCSGTIINNNTILTIKHAIEYEKFNIFYNNQLLNIDNVIFHKKEDLALIKIKNSIDVPVIEFYENAALIGKICSIGGYGVKYDPASKKRGNVDLIKRAGKNVIVWETDYYFECLMDSAGVELEFIPTIGDSGGPVYIDNKLVGINKYVKSSDGKSDSGFGDISGHIKIQMYKGWINKYLV